MERRRKILSYFKGSKGKEGGTSLSLHVSQARKGADVASVYDFKEGGEGDSSKKKRRGEK